MSDVISSPAELAPALVVRLTAAMNRARTRGLDPHVFETFRGPARQADAYARGFSNAATVWQSWHYFGLAADVVSASQWWAAPFGWWRTWGECVELEGLTWGGRFSKPDYPHVQWGPPMRKTPSWRARVLYLSGGRDAVWRAVGASAVIVTVPPSDATTATMSGSPS